MILGRSGTSDRAGYLKMAVKDEKYLLSRLARKLHVPRRFKLKDWDKLALRSVSIKVSPTLNVITFCDSKTMTRSWEK